MAPAGANWIYVWGRPGTDKTLFKLSLNVHSTNDGIIDFTRVTMFDPLLLDFGFPFTPFVRYEFVADRPGGLSPSPDGNRIDGFQGFTVASQAVIGIENSTQSREVAEGQHAHNEGEPQARVPVRSSTTEGAVD